MSAEQSCEEDRIQTFRHPFFATLQAGECVELRVLGIPTSYGSITASGYFDNAEDLEREAHKLTLHGGNAYCTINPCPIDLAARTGINKASTRKGLVTTSDKDILRRTLLLFDLDHERPSGIAANDYELNAALDVGRKMAADLRREGWPEPVVINSGNGCHLIYRIEMGNTPNDLAIIKRTLKWANDRWGSPGGVKIDQSVCNAARISRLPGSINRKGAGSPERPHRRSEIISLPSALLPVPPAVLGGLEEPEKVAPGRGSFDLEEWLANHLPYAKGPIPYESGHKWILEVCPWNAQHDNSAAFVIRHGDGRLGAGCLHDGCRGNGWRQLRALFEGPRQEPSWTPSEPCDHYQPETDYTEELPPADLNELPFTDLGNAKAMVQLFGNRFKFCPVTKKWYVWNRLKWIEDKLNQVLVFANKTVEAREKNSQGIGDEDLRKSAFRFFRSCQSVARRNALIEQAKAWQPALVTTDDLDQNTWLLNCRNGTLDLRTGIIRPHDQADLITKCVDTDYEPGASCPRWISYLEQSMGGDVELVDFIRRAIGYTLTGETDEHALFVNVGKGENGKSVFMTILSDLLGDYAANTQHGTFAEKKNDSTRNDLAGLMGARLVHCSETNDNFRFDEALIKQLTGGDKITARFLYGEFFAFRPAFKIWIASNYQPEIRGIDDGIWRRIKFIPWAVKVNPWERDPKLVAKLRAELPGILAWAVSGCRDWQQGGLCEPESIRRAAESNREDSDIMVQFLTECCEVGPRHECQSSQLYAVFRQWLVNRGEYELSMVKMARMLKYKGYVCEKGRQFNVWKGISVKCF